MYSLVGRIDEADRLRRLDQPRDWKHKIGEKSDYWASVIDGHRMFIKLCPGGRLHAHTDDAEPKTHVVLQTNPQAMSRSGSTVTALEQGGIYTMDPKIEHESWNNGTTDRIHYILS